MHIAASIASLLGILVLLSLVRSRKSKAEELPEPMVLQPMMKKEWQQRIFRSAGEGRPVVIYRSMPDSARLAKALQAELNQLLAWLPAGISYNSGEIIYDVPQDRSRRNLLEGTVSIRFFYQPVA